MNAMSKNSNVFTKIWEWFAHIQSFIDDALQITFKKIQDKSSEHTTSDDKIHKKLIITFSKAVWDLWNWFYEKYRELKSSPDNKAENFINTKIKDFNLRSVILKAKMTILWVQRWNLESIKRLKDPRWDDFNNKVVLLIESWLEDKNKK